MRADDQRGRPVTPDFLRVARTGQHGDLAARQAFGEHLTHPAAGAELDALRAGQQQRTVRR